MTAHRPTRSHGPKSRAPSLRRSPRGRLMVLVASAIAVSALALITSPSLAATGSVYYDLKENVGAGHNLFGGTAPAGLDNVGLGYSVMPNLTTGNNNVASGSGALYSNTTGHDNVATGTEALFSNVTGVQNVATGSIALSSNTTGHDNVATGFEALFSNTTGYDNVATGSYALNHNDGSGRVSGRQNVAVGFKALFANTFGDENTALGDQALAANTGNSNLALGSGAGANLTTGSDNVDIANSGVGGESGAIRIGTAGSQKRAFLAGVSGTPVSGGVPVLINSAGKLGTATAASRLGNEAVGGGVVGRLKARNRREDDEIDRQAREIAALKREVARLAGR